MPARLVFLWQGGAAQHHRALYFFRSEPLRLGLLVDSLLTLCSVMLTPLVLANNGSNQLGIIYMSAAFGRLASLSLLIFSQSAAHNAIGYWLLAIGYWLLAIGYWLLAIGYWLLAIGTNSVLSISVFSHRLYGVDARLWRARVHRVCRRQSGGRMQQHDLAKSLFKVF